MNKKTGEEIVEKITKLIYLSAFLSKEKPLSALFVAPPEQSKSYYIMKYKTKYSHISTDLSYMGITNLLLRNNELKQIIVPDLLKVTQKNKNTKNATITTINSFIEEGIFSLNLANEKEIDLKGRTGGILTATTKDSFIQNKKTWDSMGFTSRFLIVSWTYSKKKMEELSKKVLLEDTTLKLEPKILKTNKKYIKISPEIAEKIGFLADFSPRKAKNLKVLSKTLALYNQKTEVTDQEIEELKELNQFMNQDFNLIRSSNE